MAPNPESFSDPINVVVISQIHEITPNISKSTNQEVVEIEENVQKVDPESTEVKSESALSINCKINLVIFAITEIVGGFTFSLLAPFYTQEATSKNLTVSQTGMVYSSVFITTIIFSPIFGKYIGYLGSRRLFIYGTFVAGATNILFGFLEWVEDSTSFLALSLSIRIVSAIGESAFFCAIYPLATKDVPVEKRSTILSVMETMFGLGMMVGPFLGGLLYNIDGFYFPFVICGGSLVICALVSSYLLKSSTTGTMTSGTLENNASESIKEASKSVKFTDLLKMPSISISCFLLIISEMSVTWYLPSLEPFLEENFNNISTVATGAMFMVEGATYAIFSPIWGLLLDRGLSPHLTLLMGCFGVVIGFSLLGPAPFLSYILPTNLFVVAIGLIIQGAFVAATFITTLVFMMNESVANGAPDNEQTRGMITSLWFMSENIAGYLGSTLGGYTFDKMGFENSTLIVIGMQLIALLPLFVLFYYNRKSALKFEKKQHKKFAKKYKYQLLTECE